MEKNKTGLFWLLLFLIQHTGFGQTTQKYLVLLQDKANSPYSISQPEAFLSERSIQRRQKQNIAILERDLPVNPSYVTQLNQTGAKVWYTSRWLNAALVETTESTIETIKKLSFIKGIEFDRSLNKTMGVANPTVRPMNKFSSARIAADTLNYGSSELQLSQIGADKMHQQGFLGEGMLIAILDAGFNNANNVSYLKPLFDENRLIATYDFVDQETSVYEDDSHGTNVLSTIAATADGQLYGTAYKASFILLRTEYVSTETQVEEANWLFAAEYADSAGVDVINSSLGYTEFDDTSTSYTYQDMNGQTALSTRAAQIATETGMVVVVSAGNDGNNSWHYIGAPADATSVLAIGAITQTGQQASFSSFGPSADGRIKPDLAARGQGTIVGLPNGNISLSNGTSFSSPLVAGLAAGFWQAYPGLTATLVTDILRRSGSLYSTPDNALGYGIPDFERASTIAQTYFPLAIEPNSLPLLVFSNPFSDSQPLRIQLGGINAGTSINASLRDLNGRIIWENTPIANDASAFTLPNLGLASGTYVMTVVAGNKKRTLKVVKQ